MKCYLPFCETNANSAGLCSTHYRNRLRDGRAGFVDSAPSLKRIQELRDLGWSYHLIGQACGKWHSSIRDLLDDKPSVVRKATHDAVMSIQVELGVGRLSVDPTGTIRRIRALNWMGWTARRLSVECGLKPMSLSQISWRGSVSAGTRTAVAKVYERLHDQEGPSSRIRAIARTRKWDPPAAWDEDTIDDPSAEPNYGGFDEKTVQLLVAGEWVKATNEDRVEAVARLAEGGLDEYQIARVLRSTPDKVRARLAGAA